MKGFILTVSIFLFLPSSFHTSVFASGLANSSWPTYRGNNQRQGFVNQMGDSKSWVRKLIYTDPNKINLGTPITGVDGSIYTIGQSKEVGGLYLYAITPGGDLKWKALIPTQNTTTSGPSVDKDNNIWLLTQSATNILLSYTAEGKLRCAYDTILNISPGGTSNLIDKNGNVYFALQENTNTSELFSVSKDCHLNWTTSITKRITGFLALSTDEKTLYISGQYPGSESGPIMAKRTSDGMSFWETGAGSMWEGVSVTTDNSILFAITNSGFPDLTPNIYARDPKTGTVLWSQVITPARTDSVGGAVFGGRGIVAIDDKNNSYINLYDKIVSYSKTGYLRWTYNNSSGHYIGASIYTLVDTKGHVYIPSQDGNIYVLDSNKGTLIEKVNGSVGYPVYGGNDNFYYVSTKYLYALVPWDISLSVTIPSETDKTKASVASYIPITFTAKTQMPKQDPTTNITDVKIDIPNQMQVRLNNGQNIPLVYKSTDNNETIWEAVYKIPKGTNNTTALKGSVEAIAYNTTTTTQTHFSTVPAKFNNTGISMDFTVSTATPGAYTVKKVDEKTVATFTASPAKGESQNFFVAFFNLIFSFIKNLIARLI